MRGRMMRFTGLLTVFAMILTACTTGPGTTETTDSTQPRPVARVGDRPPLIGRHLLVNFDACDPFLDYLIENAVEMVGPY